MSNVRHGRAPDGSVSPEEILSAPPGTEKALPACPWGPPDEASFRICVRSGHVTFDPTDKDNCGALICRLGRDPTAREQCIDSHEACERARTKIASRSPAGIVGGLLTMMSASSAVTFLEAARRTAKAIEIEDTKPKETT